MRSITNHGILAYILFITVWSLTGYTGEPRHTFMYVTILLKAAEHLFFKWMPTLLGGAGPALHAHFTIVLYRINIEEDIVVILS